MTTRLDFAVNVYTRSSATQNHRLLPMTVASGEKAYFRMLYRDLAKHLIPPIGGKHSDVRVLSSG